MTGGQEEHRGRSPTIQRYTDRKQSKRARCVVAVQCIVGVC